MSHDHKHTQINAKLRMLAAKMEAEWLPCPVSDCRDGLDWEQRLCVLSAMEREWY